MTCNILKYFYNQQLRFAKEKIVFIFGLNKFLVPINIVNFVYSSHKKE